MVYLELLLDRKQMACHFFANWSSQAEDRTVVKGRTMHNYLFDALSFHQNSASLSIVLGSGKENCI